ncbi:hypothetical protein [Kribbella sindirgiensis]|uniref:HEAT repeat domain-containing protein n=1 Tax=Kribbella sindirgiensis TaxID=1124744 RepID=A0A4R0I2D0_9ACTN|nr:hypothetical protein [Kribbella sindirgiensis]TCC20562.1 hypothetical protein E0H50_36645 [Kribbella sindirgiensis]
MDNSHYEAFLAYTDYDPEYVEAEQYLAKALQVDLDDDEHFGDDWVIEPADWMLARCRAVVESQPKPDVLDALVLGLHGSYQRKAVHDLLTAIARQAVTLWRAGDQGLRVRDLIRDTAHAYKYGTRATDLDFVLEFCDEPTFAAEGDDHEDLRAYWFDSLIKIKQPTVAEFARAIARTDLGRWEDYRITGALRIIGRVWEPGDAELCSQIASDYPDAEIRRDAKRILKRHGTLGS